MADNDASLASRSSGVKVNGKFFITIIEEAAKLGKEEGGREGAGGTRYHLQCQSNNGVFFKGKEKEKRRKLMLDKSKNGGNEHLDYFCRLECGVDNLTQDGKMRGEADRTEE